MLKLKFGLLIGIPLLFVPEHAFAWGPLTHIYLGTNIFNLGFLLPAGIYSIIKRYGQDFLYGNLMADFVLAKKYLPKKKNPHSWEVGLDLLESSTTKSQKAFSYGYLSHLAADTVAHDIYTKDAKSYEHMFLELRADGVVDRSYWLSALSIGRNVQRRNDHFLRRCSKDRIFFTFNTNKRIFKSMVVLSGLNGGGIAKYLDRRMMLSPRASLDNIEKLQFESIERMIDVLEHGADSKVIKEDPNGNCKRNRILYNILR